KLRIASITVSRSRHSNSTTSPGNRVWSISTRQPSMSPFQWSVGSMESRSALFPERFLERFVLGDDLFHEPAFEVDQFFAQVGVAGGENLNGEDTGIAGTAHADRDACN